MRLTTRTEDGRAALKLENPKTEKEARKQLHDKFLLAMEKLARYEDLEEPDPETGLKPCPMCGGKAVIASFTTLNSEKPKFEVECSNCWCETDWNNSTPEEAITAWNRRAGEQE